MDKNQRKEEGNLHVQKKNEHQGRKAMGKATPSWKHVNVVDVQWHLRGTTLLALKQPCPAWVDGYDTSR